MNDTVNQAMAVSITSMRALKEQVKTLDNAIEQQFEIIPNTLTSIPGIGKVYSAGIIRENPDLLNEYRRGFFLCWEVFSAAFCQALTIEN